MIEVDLQNYLSKWKDLHWKRFDG